MLGWSVSSPRPPPETTPFGILAAASGCFCGCFDVFVAR